MAAGLDCDSWHAGQDREKRVIVQQAFDLCGHLAPLPLELSELAGDCGDYGFRGCCAGDGDGLFTDGLEQAVDNGFPVA